MLDVENVDGISLRYVGQLSAVQYCMVQAFKGVDISFRFVGAMRLALLGTPSYFQHTPHIYRTAG